MNNILSKLKVSTTQGILLGALAIGIGAGAYSAATQHPATSKPPVTQFKSASDTTSSPATTTAPDPVSNTTLTSDNAPSTTNTVPARSTTSSATATTAPSAPVTVTKSTYSGDNNSGVCNLSYSDGTSGQVAATLTTKDAAWHVTTTTDNCDSFIGTTK